MEMKKILIKIKKEKKKEKIKLMKKDKKKENSLKKRAKNQLYFFYDLCYYNNGILWQVWNEYSSKFYIKKNKR